MHRSLNIGFKFMCIVFPIAGSLNNANAQDFAWRGSVSYSTGNYFFSENTGSLYINNGLAIDYKGVSFSVGVPYVIQNSPWVSYGTTGGLPTGGTQNGDVKRSGTGTGGQMGNGNGRHTIVPLEDTTSYRQSSFSDPSVSGSVKLINSYQNRTSVVLNGQLKIPVSNPSSGFGTGAWDGGLGLSVSQTAGRSVMFFADLMYWWLGDMNELPLNNALAYGVGIGKIFSTSGWIISASLNGFTAIMDGFDPPLTVSTGTGYRVSDRTNLNLTISTGLTESSPDYTAGFGWFVKFN